MKSKIYLFILISLGFAPLKAQKKFSGGAGVSLLASQIDGDQAAGYSKFGGSIEVFTRFSLEKYSLQLRMGLGERGSRRNITKNPGTPMHLRYRTLDVTGGILKPINKKWKLAYPSFAPEGFLPLIQKGILITWKATAGRILFWEN